MPALPSWPAAVLLCLTVPLTARAQDRDLDLVLPPLGFERLPWREIRVPDKRQWLARAGVSLAQFEPADRDRARIVDIDADGRPDIVISGVHGAGAEGVETHVYINAGTRFEHTVFGSEEVYALGQLAPGQTPGLVLIEQPFGMCEVSDRHLRLLRRTSPPDTALYEQVEEIRFGLAGSRLPRTALTTPLSIRVTQDRYNLRAAPVLDDTTDIGDCEEHHGNVFAILPLGATARVLAQERVGTRLWYFVLTDPGIAVTWPGDRGGETLRARLVGWVSSRWTETIPAGPPSPPGIPPRRGAAHP